MYRVQGIGFRGMGSKVFRFRGNGVLGSGLRAQDLGYRA